MTEIVQCFALGGAVRVLFFFGCATTPGMEAASSSGGIDQCPISADFSGDELRAQPANGGAGQCMSEGCAPHRMGWTSFEELSLRALR